MHDHEDVQQAFLEALRHGRTDLADAASEVGASAATQGLPLRVVLDHVERAYGPATPDVATVRVVAESWADSMTAGVFDVSCHDPLTSWGSVPHLRAHLEDLYRRARHRGESAPDTHALIVVETGDAHRGHGIEVALRALEVADVLQTVFPAYVTLAQLADHRFAALVEAVDADHVGTALLARMLQGAFPDPPHPRQWVERLPRDTDGIAWLLSGLTR